MPAFVFAAASTPRRNAPACLLASIALLLVAAAVTLDRRPIARAARASPMRPSSRTQPPAKSSHIPAWAFVLVRNAPVAWMSWRSHRSHGVGPVPRPPRTRNACSTIASALGAALGSRPNPYTHRSAFSTTAVRIGYKFFSPPRDTWRIGEPQTRPPGSTSRTGAIIKGRIEAVGWTGRIESEAAGPAASRAGRARKSARKSERVLSHAPQKVSQSSSECAADDAFVAASLRAEAGAETGAVAGVVR